MNGTISIQRIYALGNYENLTVKTELTNVPEEVTNDPTLTSALQLLLLLNVETAYRTYIDILTKVPQRMDTDTALADLESMRKSIYQLFEGRRQNEFKN